MGEFHKMCIALVFVCLPLGCAAPSQETRESQIQCADPQRADPLHWPVQGGKLERVPRPVGRLDGRLLSQDRVQ